MELSPLISSLAAAGNLLVCALAATRRPRAPGRRPLALLCLSLALWNLAAVLELAVSRLAVATLLPALMLTFVLRFLERRRRGILALHWGLTWCFFGVTLSAAAWPPARRFIDSTDWNLAYLAVLLPPALWGLWLLGTAHRSEAHPRRRLTIRWVLAAAGVGLATGAADLLGTSLPRLGPLGSLAAMALLGVAILKFHLLEIDVALGRLVVLLVLAALPPLALYPMMQAPPTVVLAVTASSFVALGLGGWAVAGWQEQAERQRRLAELGEVSALLAHEIRNPLASIKGAAQYLQGELKEGRPAEFVGLILGEIDRLDAALSDVQYFVRPAQVDGTLTDINAVVEKVVRAQPAAPTLRVSPGLPLVRADARLLTQVLINLIKNGVEAGGSVTVETRAGPGSVVVAVRDTGPGLSEDVLERLFEPYFTTKTRGMGLGLALSRRIAEAHGGTLEAENLLGGGAEFRLELPALRG